MECKEIINLIADLNAEVYEMCSLGGDECDEYDLFEFHTNGDAQIILFFGCQIWNSEDDDSEELEKYLRREAQEIIDTIKQMQLIRTNN